MQTIGNRISTCSKDKETTFTVNFRHNLRAKKLFSKKIHSRWKPCKYYTSRVLYIPFYSLNSQIFGTKPLPRRRFLQHYYRGANVETQKLQKAHRSPIDVLILFYACADSSEWGLFGRCARSAFRRTPSGPETCRKFVDY